MFGYLNISVSSINLTAVGSFVDVSIWLSDMKVIWLNRPLVFLDISLNHFKFVTRGMKVSIEDLLLDCFNVTTSFSHIL